MEAGHEDDGGRDEEAEEEEVLEAATYEDGDSIEMQIVPSVINGSGSGRHATRAPVLRSMRAGGASAPASQLLPRRHHLRSSSGGGDSNPSAGADTDPDSLSYAPSALHSVRVSGGASPSPPRRRRRRRGSAMVGDDQDATDGSSSWAADADGEGEYDDGEHENLGTDSSNIIRTVRAGGATSPSFLHQSHWAIDNVELNAGIGSGGDSSDAAGLCSSSGSLRTVRAGGASSSIIQSAEKEHGMDQTAGNADSGIQRLASEIHVSVEKESEGNEHDEGDVELEEVAMEEENIDTEHNFSAMEDGRATGRVTRRHSEQHEQLTCGVNSYLGALLSILSRHWLSDCKWPHSMHCRHHAPMVQSGQSLCSTRFPRLHLARLRSG